MLMEYLEEKLTDLVRQQPAHNRLTRWTAYAYALALVLGGVEYIAPGNFKLGAFYLVPTGLAALKCGKKRGYVLAFFCGASLELADWLAGKQWLSLELGWNIVLSSLALMLFVFFVSSLSAIFEQQTRALRVDGLTGLLSLPAFEEALAKEVERCRRFKHAFSVAYIGCNNFKFIFDKYGASATEGIMRLTAQCLRSSYRGTDVIARIDDDAFVILLTETVGEASLVAVKKLNTSLEEIITRHYPELTFAIGLVCFSQCSYSSREVLNMAEVACLQARAANQKMFQTVGA